MDSRPIPPRRGGPHGCAPDFAADERLQAPDGFLFFNGRGVAKDPARALALLDRACSSGVASACNNLGVMYGNGPGVAKDVPRAKGFFKQACDGGYASACDTLKKLP